MGHRPWAGVALEQGLKHSDISSGACLLSPSLPTCPRVADVLSSRSSFFSSCAGQRVRATRSMFLQSVLLLFGLAQCFRFSDAVTIYNQAGPMNPTAASSSSGAQATLGNVGWVSALNAYDNVRLQPPALPSPMPSTSFALALPNQAEHMSGLSIPQRGDFYGFSIEMSVVEQVSECRLSCSGLYALSFSSSESTVARTQLARMREYFQVLRMSIVELTVCQALSFRFRFSTCSPPSRTEATMSASEWAETRRKWRHS